MAYGMTEWPIEEVPDDDALYRRANRVHVRGDGIEPGAFKAYPRGSERMSVDWERYSSPEESVGRMGNAENNALVKLIAGQVRSELGLQVNHRPLPENRSHSEVLGKNTEGMRVKLSRLCILVIPLKN